MSDLIRLLQGLGDAEHDDLEVAYDAIAEIVRLREELSDATAELEQARETNKRLNRRCQSYEAGLKEKIEKGRAEHRNLGRMLANSAAEMYRAELAQARKDLAQAYIDIALLPCGKPDAKWTDFVAVSAQDAWQIAFSAGLMAAGRRVKRLLHTKESVDDR